MSTPRLAVPLGLRLWDFGQRPSKAGWKRGHYSRPGHPGNRPSPPTTVSSVILNFKLSCRHPEGDCMEGGDKSLKKRGPWRQSTYLV